MQDRSWMQDHYGLEEVKERVLEYLAVRALTHKGGSTGAFVWRDLRGTGKTSIAPSLGQSVRENRMVRTSLGGVRDEAEIRGHRKDLCGGDARTDCQCESESRPE